MAQPTQTFDSYDARGNREDLQDKIYNISPTDTPVLNACKKVKANAVYHEWQTDALASASTSNAHIEGDDSTGDAVAATSRVGNYCQIFKKTVVVSGTQEVVNKAGRKSEVAYQAAKKMKEMLRDIEATITFNQTQVAGDNTTARKLRSLCAWYSTNISRGTGGANGSTTQAATDATTGDLRTFTEALLLDTMQSVYNAGGDPGLVSVGLTNKRRFSGFTGNATRQVDAKSNKLIQSIDLYESDFGVVKVVANRFQRARDCHIISPEFLGIGTLRPIQKQDLARTGDSKKFDMITELTLVVMNEGAHGIVADLTS